MSTESSSSSKRLLALTGAAAMLTAIGLASAPSWAQEESPSPSESASESAMEESPSESASESASAEETSDGAHNPAYEAPETVDTYVGQSVQTRMDADAQPNSNLTFFRWAATQVSAESLNNLDVAVPLPMDEAPLLRSLTGHGNMATEVDGGVIYEFPAVNGNSTKRTLNLWPKDRDLPVNVTTKFWIDGQEVKAGDVVGKSGVHIKAEYTIHNLTVENRNTKFENISGEEDEMEVESSLGMVGIAKAFIPQAWAQFDAGHGGIYGADGRGNFQTQWIKLAFLPFAENGVASYEWSAVVPEDEKAFIPKMVLEISPLFVPPHEEGEEEEPAAEDDNGVPKPDLDPATSMIQAGVKDLVNGVEAIMDLIPESDEPPKPPLAERLPDIITTLEGISGDLQGFIDQLNVAIEGGEGVTVGNLITAVDLAIASTKDSVADLEQLRAEVCAEINQGPAPDRPQLDQGGCDDLNQAIENMQKTVTDLEEVKTQLQAVEDQDTPISSTVLTEIRDGLQGIKDSVDGVVSGLQGLLGTLNAAGEAADLASSGKAQISAGIGAASEEVQAYIANVVAVAQAAAAEGKDAAEEIKAEANHIKAELAGLKVRLAESPLPYGGGLNTVYAPAGNETAVKDQAVSLLGTAAVVEGTEGVQPTTKVFGAYQFMLDPADTNKSNTKWRILIALLLAAGAGMLGVRVAQSRA